MFLKIANVYIQNVKFLCIFRYYFCAFVGILLTLELILTPGNSPNYVFKSTISCCHVRWLGAGMDWAYICIQVAQLAEAATPRVRFMIIKGSQVTLESQLTLATCRWKKPTNEHKRICKCRVLLLLKENSPQGILASIVVILPGQALGHFCGQAPPPPPLGFRLFLNIYLTVTYTVFVFCYSLLLFCIQLTAPAQGKSDLPRPFARCR